MNKTAKTLSAVRFVGGGDEYIMGVPTRDLDPQEWERLPEKLQEKCIKTGLYQPVYIKEQDNGTST